MTVAVFFGGYRQHELFQPTNAYSFWLEQIGKIENSIVNVWNGRSDDRLIDRWQRAETALDRIEEEKKGTIDVHILTWSIGCDLAVKFVHKLLNHGKNGASSLTLIAPDPKYKRNPLDRIESAYDEAKQLWHTKKKPGKKFTSKLKKIIENFGNDKFRAVYSKLDTIATWPGNVAKMHTDLGGNGNWHEIKVAGNSSPKHLPIQLEPTQAKYEHWIHEQLFEKLATPARSRASLQLALYSSLWPFGRICRASGRRRSSLRHPG